MLILISGQPGNGKTLRAMALAEEEFNRNAAAVKEGKEQPRRFFCNIAGATTEENPQAFPWMEKLPHHNDWTQLPDGSFVVYDEAHSDGATLGLERYGRLFPSTGKPGESDDPRIRAMSTHRHRGFDLVLVTQWPSKIHHNARQLVGKHIHMNRAMGLQRAGALTWSRAQPDPYDEREREKAEEEIWSYPPSLYTRYKSATLHTATYKFKVPKKVWQALSTVVMMVLVGWALWVFVFKPDAKASPASDDKEKAAVALAPLGAGEPPSSSADEPRWESDPDAPEYRRDYARDHLPRFPTMPWSAPVFDDRQVVSDPILVCASAAAGEDVNGQHREASCTCLTEQGTRYRLPPGECQRMAKEGPVYNPYKVTVAVAMAGGVGGMPPTAMAAPAAAPSPGAAITSAQVTGYGDIAARRIEAAPVDRW